MNGYKVLEEAAKLQGISALDDNLKIIGLSIINAVLGEMGFAELDSLSNPVGLASPAQRRTLIAGVAMFIAAAVGDQDLRNAFSEDYNKKLAKLSFKTGRIKDVLPKGEWQ